MVLVMLGMAYEWLFLCTAKLLALARIGKRTGKLRTALSYSARRLQRPIQKFQVMNSFLLFYFWF